MSVESGKEDIPLNPNELLTADGQVVRLAVEDNHLVVGSRRLSLAEIQFLIAPETRISPVGPPTLQQIAKEYDEMDCQLQLEDLTFKGYRGKEGTYKAGEHYLVIIDSTGKPCAAFDALLLLQLGEKYGS